MAISTIKVTFDADNVDFGIITTSNNAAGSNWFVGIEGPAGTIQTLDTGSPDGTGTGISIAIADISSSIQDGEYTVEVQIQDPGGYTESQKTKFTLAQTGEITYSITHTDRVISFRDTTVYPTQTGTPAYTRTSLVTKPTPAGGVPPETATFTGSQLSLDMSLGDGKIYENVQWSIVGSGSGQFIETQPFALGFSGVWSFVYDRTYTGADNHFVVITTDPCGFINCLDEVWQTLVQDASRKGGLRALDTYKSEQLALMLGHTAMYNYWKSCGDIAQAQYYYERLASLGECELTTTPRAVTGQVTTGQWINIPPGSYLNGFEIDDTSLVPFQYMVIGNQMFFRGGILPSSESSAGLDLIDPSYWASVGITLYADCFIPCLDNTGVTAISELYYAKTVGGTIRIYSFASNSEALGFGLAGTLPIAT